MWSTCHCKSNRQPFNIRSHLTVENEENWTAFRVGCVGWSRTEKKYDSLSPDWEVISGPPSTAKVLGSSLSLLARTWGRGVGSCVRWRTGLPVAVAVSSYASLLIRLIVPHHRRFRSRGVAKQSFWGFYNPERALVIFLLFCLLFSQIDGRN